MFGPNVEIRAWWGRLLVGRNPRRTLLRIGLLVVLSFFTFRYLLIPIRVSGPSMYPTYQTGRPNLVNRLAYLFHEPRRGDIIGIRIAGLQVMYMKRVIGLPGEHVQIRRGAVYIDGERLEEPYVKHPAPFDRAEMHLAPNEYFVAGDNRANSENGRIQRERIVGKVLF